jgi:hypothetical protein
MKKRGSDIDEIESRLENIILMDLPAKGKCHYVVMNRDNEVEECAREIGYIILHELYGHLKWRHIDA